MAVVEQEGFGDIYRADDLALFARTKNDFMAFSYYASKTLDSDAIPKARRLTITCCTARKTIRT